MKDELDKDFFILHPSEAGRATPHPSMIGRSRRTASTPFGETDEAASPAVVRTPGPDVVAARARLGPLFLVPDPWFWQGTRDKGRGTRHRFSLPRRPVVFQPSPAGPR